MEFSLSQREGKLACIVADRLATGWTRPGAGDPFVLPRRLATIRRLPPIQVERTAALVDADGMLTLHELADVPAGSERPGEPLVTVTDDVDDRDVRQDGPY